MWNNLKNKSKKVRLKYNQYYNYDEHFTVFKDTKEIKYKKMTSLYCS